MSVFFIVEEGTPNAVESSNYPGVFVREEYIGAVVAVFERNGYSDSDFLATVWDAAQGKTIDVQFASTAYWSYAASAKVDASCAVLQAAAAYSERLVNEMRAAAEKQEASMVRTGRMVTVQFKTGPRKHLNGLSGKVFWVGVSKFNSREYNAGVEFSDGSKEFINVKNLLVQALPETKE